MKCGGFMTKPSYVNITRVYEWPLRCFKPSFRDKSLRACSLGYVHRLAADVIADKLMQTSFCLRPEVKKQVGVLVDGSDISEPVVTGTLCWLHDLSGTPGYDSNGRTELQLKGPGPCLIVATRNKDCSDKSYQEVTVCAVSMLIAAGT